MKSVDNQRPLKVFLCHAHADRDPVRGLYTRLTQDGVDAWLDKEKLLPGQDWELEIRKAVREADVVVVCLSKQFNQAGFRQKEVRLALDTAMEKPEGEIFIIPARLEECNTLESLRRWHWVDLFEDDGYEMLMKALRVRAHRIGVTLQIKKSWLPKITSPLSKPAKPIKENNLESSKKKRTEEKNDIPDEPPPDNFPDGWDYVWKKGFESASNVEKSELEKKEEDVVETPVEKKREEANPKNFNRNIFGVIGFIVLVLVSIFGLPSLIGKPEVPAPTVANTAGFKTFTPIPETFTPISASKTETLVPTSTPSGPIFLRDLNGNASPVIRLAFSSDGKILISGSGDGTINVWQTDDGNISNMIKEDYWGVWIWFAFSPDGKTVATGSWKDMSVKLVRISDNTIVRSFAAKDNGMATSIAISHDGKMLAVSHWVDNVVRLWQVDNGKLLRTLEGLGNKMSFSNDNTVIGILYGNELKIRSTSNGNLVYSLTDSVESFAFSPDSKILVLGLSNGAISLRRVSDGAEISILTGHAGGVQSVSFSPDGEFLASGSSDETIKLWNIPNKQLAFTISENVNGVISLGFSENGKMLASGADDGTIKLWSFVR